MKKLVLLLSVVAALFVAPTAQAETYYHYISCPTGAYVLVINMTWTGSHWVTTYDRYSMYGYC